MPPENWWLGRWISLYVSAYFQGRKYVRFREGKPSRVAPYSKGCLSTRADSLIVAALCRMCGKWPWLTPNWMGRCRLIQWRKDPNEKWWRSTKTRIGSWVSDGYRYLKLCPNFGGIQYMYMYFYVICVCVYFLHYIRICLHSLYKICASDAKCAQGIYIYIYVHTTVWIRKVPSPLHLKVFQITSTSWHRLSYKNITSGIINLGSWRGSRYVESELNIQKWSWWWNSGILGKDHPICASFNTSPGCKKHRRDKRKPPVLGKSLILGYLSNFLTFLIDSPTSICSSNFATYPASLTSLPRWGKKIRLKQLTSFMPIPSPAKKGLEISMND